MGMGSFKKQKQVNSQQVIFAAQMATEFQPKGLNTVGEWYPHWSLLSSLKRLFKGFELGFEFIVAPFGPEPS